ncbi:hypothetical protein PHYBLDRAFT_134296 [Phycomyces blakesleeanus NRRL 1555(-)]|uniref:NADPH--cytochrome P450 reductase n=2 Tax=Phycomyces blakesleeanus TaxID=4837 RepID=A0A163ABZ5_PHYB8|nr:hypothetical protein PHYBLDRAFT_134296 [Phycomyces blakesleeanus NRRL 1555(-)]OAD72461.1 hypothetical protein PHYBLDRAFT_134296 [Phycomyces blakesleeanus NRRL 1555(-)]|eukprot:XP_018290501.1 hypothetical protein PHYBLDRAFT_134296 [Phycomyces blakesleeanus NRRL 1555(-)]
MESLDIILLGTIGLGTIAWFARHQIANTFKSSKDTVIDDSESSEKPTPKAERNFVKIMKEQGRQVIIFYGSQTGTAEDYAARLAKESSQKYNVSCMTADLELYDLSYLDTLPKECLAIFVLATYGEGEPTDNAVEFWDMLNDESVEFSQSESQSESDSGSPLSNLRFIVFGLGNKTYEHYNSVCRTVDKRLEQLGGTRVCERGEGDDDSSLEDDFLAWQETLWPAFCEAMGVDENPTSSGPRQPTYKVDELDSFENDLVYMGEISERPKDSTSAIVYDAKRPFAATVTSRELFFVKDRHCLHMEIDLGDSNLSYQTGDHIAIWPTNNEVQVKRLASILGLQDKLDRVVNVSSVDAAASKQHPFPVPTTYRTIFRHYLDICAIPSRQTLMSLVDFAPNDASRAFLQTLATDKEAYKSQVSEPVRNLGEVLELVARAGKLDQDQDQDRKTNTEANGNHSTKGAFEAVPFDLVVESISRLQPRYYSISSSSKESPRSISVTVVMLDYKPQKSNNERTVYGVATNYLWSIHAAVHELEKPVGYPDYVVAGPRGSYMNDDKSVVKVPVHVRRSQFKLPRNPTVPVIMVGPGTGVAPFRAFVRERAAQKLDKKPVGPTVLFFGCRHSQQDYLYADEWPGLFETLGEDSRIITAFSREHAEKVYVQHRLEQEGEEMWGLLERGAYVYVCGDAKSMAKDVQHTFTVIAQQYGNKTEEKAAEFIKSLRSTGRYQEDVW